MTMRQKRCNTRDGRRRARKRPLTLASISAILTSSATLMGASGSGGSHQHGHQHGPLHQHRLGAPKRAVPYSHVVEESRKEAFSPFWVPSQRDSGRYERESSAIASSHSFFNSEGRRQRQQQQQRTGTSTGGRSLLETATGINGEKANEEENHQQQQQDEDFFSHVLADASLENPDELFREVRRKSRNLQQTAGRQVDSRTSNNNNNNNNGLRRAAAEGEAAKPVGDLAGGDAGVEEASAGFINTDLGDGSSASNETDFNVTAGTDYNVTVSVHEEGGNSTNDTSTVIYTESERTKNSTSTFERGKEFRPIRIRAYLSEIEGGGQYLTDREHEALLQDIVRPALLSWSSALRVDPVIGNLTVDASQLVDGVTCGPGRDSGLPSAFVPSSHITEGVMEADLVVYLNLGFIDTNRSVFDTNATYGRNVTGISDSVKKKIAAGGRSADERDSPATSLPDVVISTGLNLSGLVDNPSMYRNQLLNHTRGEPQPCSGAYLAASSYCSTDQYDRPTAAILHICIGPDFFFKRKLQRNIMTVRHELGHSLGFNSLSLAHFRRTDGTPITPRVRGEVPVTEVECTGPLNGRSFANVTLPSEELLRFRTVRGGVRVAEVVTPSVAQVVRNHFDCQDLPGAELESGEFLPLSTDPIETSCIGDHWERRLFKSDLMNPVVQDLEFDPRVSTLDLAYFADSGWYQVDISRASLAAGWGRRAGCAFVNETCINSDGQVPARYGEFFCNTNPSLDVDGFAEDIDGCTADLSKKAACSIGQYEGELPNEYQYFHFTYGSNVGGKDPFMDYCPVYNGFTNGMCSDPENEALIRVDRMERFGERNSRCVAGYVTSRRTALCLRIACAIEDRSFHVQVEGQWKRCSYKDQVLKTQSGDKVICPDPVRVCPTFYCVRDCLGTERRCDYDLGKCVCGGVNGTCVRDGAEEDTSFYDPSSQNSSLPEDSPLSDYYVPTVRALKDEQRRFDLQDWKIIAIALSCAAVASALLFFFFKWKYRAVDGNVDGAEDEQEHSARDPNKDKMIASVVVDMRMNNPNMHDVLERVSETDISMTDTEGAGTIVSNLSITDSDAYGIEPLENDVQEVHIDPLASPDAPSIVRRRNVHDTHVH